MRLCSSPPPQTAAAPQLRRPFCQPTAWGSATLLRPPDPDTLLPQLPREPALPRQRGGHRASARVTAPGLQTVSTTERTPASASPPGALPVPPPGRRPVPAAPDHGAGHPRPPGPPAPAPPPCPSRAAPGGAAQRAARRARPSPPLPLARPRREGSAEGPARPSPAAGGRRPSPSRPAAPREPGCGRPPPCPLRTAAASRGDRRERARLEPLLTLVRGRGRLVRRLARPGSVTAPLRRAKPLTQTNKMAAAALPAAQTSRSNRQDVYC